MRSYSSATFSDVKITGPFFSARLETGLSRTIPSQHEQLARHGILDSLKLAQPVAPLRIPRNHGGFTTQIFWDSDAGTWIEAYALSHRRDADIEAAITDDLTAAPSADGYLDCWSPGREPQNRWTSLRDNHEVYNAGHPLEGAVACYNANGPVQKRSYPGHQKLALIKLYHATGLRKYLDLASYCINERGTEPHGFDLERSPRRAAPERFEPGDADLKQACETLWADVTRTRRYVTGGFGPSARIAGFTTTLPVAGGQVTLTETSTYPWSGAARITVTPAGCGAFTLARRRGPIISCLEQRDNPARAHLRLAARADITANHTPTLLGGITTLQAEAKAAVPSTRGQHRAPRTCRRHPLLPLVQPGPQPDARLAA